jgi:hypothetical protein
MHTLSRSNHVKRLNKYLNVPAFMFQASDENGSLYLDQNKYLKTDATEWPTTFTFEFWINPVGVSGVGYYLFKNYVTGVPIIYFYVSILPEGYVAASFAGNTALSTTKISRGLWNHIAFAFDAVTKITKVYLNGVLEATSIPGIGVPSTCDQGLLFGDSTFGIFGHLSEVRYWNTVRTPEQISNSYNRRRSIYFDVEPNLICYWPCTQLNDTNTQLLDIVGAQNASLYDSAGALDQTNLPDLLRTNKYPPLIQGASFPVARADITLESAFSFKHPQSLPNFTTSSMVVTWVDDTGNVQRRYLWKADGVNFGPIVIPEYNGERISASFSLEVWNIDGEDFVELFENKSLRLSITTEPVTVLDTTAVSAGSYPLTNSIFSPVFPVDFPLTFTEPPESGEVLLNIATESGDIVV